MRNAASSTVRGSRSPLLVDDEPFNVDYLEQALEELGYETVRASNGQEALEKVVTETPDLILLDVMMPFLDGFTVCRILKEHEQTRLIPIVLMTALDAREDRIKGIKAGADDFLTKPVHEEELLARIETALKLKHTVDRKIDELRQLKEHFAKFVRLVITPDSPSS
jgi:two-component system cell cycle response regulator